MHVINLAIGYTLGVKENATTKMVDHNGVKKIIMKFECMYHSHLLSV